MLVASYFLVDMGSVAQDGARRSRDVPTRASPPGVLDDLAAAVRV